MLQIKVNIMLRFLLIGSIAFITLTCTDTTIDNRIKNNIDYIDSIPCNEKDTINDYIVSCAKKYRLNDIIPSNFFNSNSSMKFISLNDTITVNLNQTMKFNKKQYLKFIIKYCDTIYFNNYINYTKAQWTFLEECLGKYYEKQLFGKITSTYSDSCVNYNSGLMVSSIGSLKINSNDSITMIMIEPKQFQFSNITKWSGQFCSMLYFNNKFALVGFQLFNNGNTKIYFLCK